MESREEVKKRAIETYQENIKKLENKNSSNDKKGEIGKFLGDSVRDWKNSRKASRTTSTLFFLQQKTGSKIENKELIKTLTSLDAQVNALDDLIDKDLEKKQKVKIAVQVAYSSIFTWSSINDRKREFVEDILIDYFENLSQIPKIEEKKLERIKETEKEEEIIQASAESYTVRAEDINAFIKIAAKALNIEENKFLEEIKKFRAREMIAIDLEDIERDLEENDPTPVVYLLKNYETEKAAKILKQIDEKLQTNLPKINLF